MTLGRWLVLFAPSEAVIRLVLRVTRQRLTHRPPFPPGPLGPGHFYRLT